MPPKPFGLGLALQIPPEDAAQNGQSDSHKKQQDSWDVFGDSVTILSKSITPYKFNAEGLIRAPKGQEAPLHFKVCEQDLFIIKELGHGACGTVHKAYYGKQGRFVAVKRISILNRETRHQLLADIKGLLDVPASPGLITFHGAYYAQGSNQINIVLDYVDGGALSDLLKQVHTIPEPLLASFARDLLSGLAALHANRMMHRDIKPANILVNLSGQAKISDFGISTFIANTMGKCETYTGTMSYMSPERVTNKPYSYPGDIWSLGLVLLECVLGRYPYNCTHGPMDLILHITSEPPALPPHGSISPALQDLLEQCLHKDPRARPPAHRLLQHPWLTGAAPVQPGELKAFMRVLCDPLEKMDELAFAFAWSYYAQVSAGAAAVEGLSQMYRVDTSLMQHLGHGAAGREAIMQLLRARVAPGGTWQLNECHSQPYGLEGDMLVHIIGTYTTPPAGAAEVPASNRSGGGSREQRRRFTECFVLSQMGRGQYYVAHQVYREQAWEGYVPGWRV